MNEAPSSPLPVALCWNAFAGARVVRRHPIDVGAATAGVFSDDDGRRWAWALDVSPVEHGGRPGWSYRAQLKLESGRAEQVNLSLEFPRAPWSETDFVLVPGAAYNGNRFSVRRIGYPPMLEDPADIGPDVPCIINDIPRLRLEPGPSRFHIRSGDAAVPAVGIYAPGQDEQVWWVTNQESGWGDHGLWIEEREDRTQATVGFETPGVRREQQFSLGTLMKPSEDRGAAVEVGQTLELTVRVFVGRATRVQDLFESLVVLRDACTRPPVVRHELPFSAAWEIQERKYNAHNFQFDRCYAGVGEGHMACWQPGWTGHGMVTQALLAEGAVLSQSRARRTLDFALGEGLAPSGYAYGFMSERVQMGDGIDPCGEICACSCWSEVCLMLAWMEVPGLYVQPDTGVISVNDHITVTSADRGLSCLTLTLYNPTRFDAIVKVLAETAAHRRIPLGQNWGGRMTRVPVRAGATVRVRMCGQGDGGVAVLPEG